MAKSRRSRRTQKPIQVVTTPPAEQSTDQAPPPAQTDIFKEVNFGKEYYYVYQELQKILIVAVAMFVVMAGLAYLV